jgi:hypothetical protein
VRCTFHPEATATTLCARCGRALCLRCADRDTTGRICAAGCDSRLSTPPSENLAMHFSAHVSHWARWARIGATTFLIGVGAATLQLAILGAVGYSASLLCLSVAWHRRRHPYRYSRWSS